MLMQFSFLKQQGLFILTTNRRRVPVGHGQFQFLLKCCLGKRIQCCYCIVPCILLWYLPLWRAVVLECSNIAPFCVVLDCDRVLWG